MQGNPYYVDLAGNFASGYNTATLPQQMKMQQQAALQEQQMNALKQAYMQQQMQDEPAMNAEKLKQLQLENKYYEPQQQADLYLKNAQAQKEQQPKMPTGEYYGLSQYYNSLPPGPEKDMAGKRLDILTSRGNGMTVYDSNGNPIVTTGGGNKPGAVGVDANGNPVAIPTTPEQTKLQNTIVGVDTVLPYFDKIIKDLGPYQTTFQQGKLGYEKFANKNLGANYEGPSTYAEGMASVKSSAEGLLSAFGLRATDQNIKNMMDIMMPQHGEATSQYEKRATKQAADFVNLQKRAQSNTQGISLANQGQEQQPIASQPNQAVQQPGQSQAQEPHPQDMLTYDNGETLTRSEAIKKGYPV